MTCIREKALLAEAGPLIAPNAERHLKSPAEMARLFAEWPHALRATRELADRLHFSLDELRYEYPREVVPGGRSPQDYLEELTWAGAEDRYRGGPPPEVKATLRKELAMIEKLDIARYFLTIHDIIRYARDGTSPPILCQGRGSAANSAVCYVLGITAVDPAQHPVRLTHPRIDRYRIAHITAEGVGLRAGGTQTGRAGLGRLHERHRRPDGRRRHPQRRRRWSTLPRSGSLQRWR